jgi:imidazolonepropionase-like amidohydrolase
LQGANDAPFANAGSPLGVEERFHISSVTRRRWIMGGKSHPRSRLFMVVVGLLIGWTSGCADPPFEVTTGIAIEDVSVVDVVNGRIIPSQTVVLERSRILAVEPADKVAIGEDVVVVQGSGKYLIPGLWDMHTHAVDEGIDEIFLPLFVATGVTGIRDMWGTLEVADRVRIGVARGERLAPRMVVAGNLIEGEEAYWPAANIAADPDDGRALVDSLVDAGSDFIKVYHTLKPEVFFAIAEQAIQRDIPFVGHVPIGMTVSQAAEAGIRSVEHATSIFVDCINEPEAPRLERIQAKVDAGLCGDLAESLKTQGTWYVPTLVTERGYTHLNRSEFQNDPRLRFLPSLIRGWWRPENDLFGSEYTDEDWLTVERGFTNFLEVTAVMAEHGVSILAGSDTPNAFAFPGFGLHDELELLVEAGLSPLEALQAATIDAARFLQSADTLGSVEPGKVADLVLLEGNPLEAISNTQTISAVVLAGLLLDRTELDEMLTRAEEKAKEPLER